MNYTLRLKDGIAELRCLPRFTYDDGTAALSEIIEADWRADMRHLLILDEGSAFSPTREGLKSLSGLMDEILSTEDLRIAIVVAKIVHYGVGRIIEARSGQGRDKVRVFLKEEAARQWLSASSPDR